MLFTKKLVNVLNSFKVIKKLNSNNNPYHTASKNLFSKNVKFNELRQFSSTSNVVDVVIIGGGAMGSSTAYWLKKKAQNDLNVLVIEKDPTYSESSTTLSVGGIRQQFSVPENIQLSLYGAEFLRSLKGRFGDEATVNCVPSGYLLLASEEGAGQLIKNSRIQNEMGAVNTILTKEKLKDRFPWMNVEDVAVGCLGLEKEGYFDPWLLLCLFRSQAQTLGANFLQGEVIGFDRTNHETGKGLTTNKLFVKRPDNTIHLVEFRQCVIAAGANSGNVSKLASIGTGEGVLSVALPVEKRKRYVYRICCQEEGLSANTPLVIDHTGAYFRRDGTGNNFLAGKSPNADQEPATDNLEVDYDWFNEQIWPFIAHRVPAFNGIKVQTAWSGFYEYNTFDENGIIGSHPYFENIYFATGFSGHGIQQSPAVGRAVSELIVNGRFETIDLTRLSFNRLIAKEPVYEVGIY